MNKPDKLLKTGRKKAKSKLHIGTDEINQLLKLAKDKQYIALAKDDVLFRENETVKGVYFLLTGKIKITKKDTENKESILYLIKSPDIVCLHSIMEEEYHLHTAASACDAMVCFIPKTEFEKILEQNMEIALNMMKMLCLRINGIENQINRYI